VQQNFCLIWLL